MGDSAEKRRIAREAGSGVARAMNDEVSSVCRVEGRDYYVLGDHPFAAFSAFKYIRYERALIGPTTRKEAKRLLRAVGAKVRLSAKMGRISFVRRRLVSLAARITEGTTAVFIDLDGAPYSRELARELKRAVRFLSRRYSVWAAVTDSRLVEKGGRATEIKPRAAFARLRSYRSKVVGRRTMLRRIKSCRAELPVTERGTVVCVE